MDMPISERRQIENEMIFRRVNEKVGAGLDEIDAMHVEDNNPHLVRDKDIELHFKCECSDESCDARIHITLSAYKKIHENRKAFIIKLKHQVDKIETVIETHDAYSIVEKNNSTAEPSDTLNSTSIRNA